MTQCPSSLARDNWRLHKIDPSISEHLISCPSCSALTVAQKAVEDEFSSSQMLAMIARIEQSSHKKIVSTFRPWRLLWFAVPAIAGSLLFAVPIEWRSAISSHSDIPETVTAAYIGAKGNPQLEVLVKRNGKVFPLNKGNSVFAQDQLAFVPRGLPKGYHFFSLGTLSAGAYVPLYPASLDEALLPLMDGNQALSGFVTIDDLPGNERLFVTFAKRPKSAGWAAKLSQMPASSELRYFTNDGEDAIVGWIVLEKK